MMKSKKKAIGFSRYDSKGNVVYSESLKKEGETVRHFYSYDDFGRRIHYRKEEDDNIFDESTVYLDNGYIQVASYNMSNDCYNNHSIKLYNTMGRIIEETTEDVYGNIIHRVYNTYKDSYDIIKAINPFTYKK